jgi:hypothetical protein
MTAPADKRTPVATTSASVTVSERLKTVGTYIEAET